MEDYDMFTVKSLPKLEDLAFEKACRSLIGDLVLCDSLFNIVPSSYHRHSSILSILGLNVSEYVLKYVRSRIDDLPGVVGEKFRERFLEKILVERPPGFRINVFYDLLLFDSLSSIKVLVPGETVDETSEFCKILVSRTPNLKSLELLLPKWPQHEESAGVLFHALTKLEQLENCVIEADMNLKNPDLYRILSDCVRLKTLHFKGVVLNDECLATLFLKNPQRIYSVKKNGFKRIMKNLHSFKLKVEDLTPVGRCMEDFYFDYCGPDYINSKLMAHLLFNLPELRMISVDPTEAPEVFRLMNSAKKMQPIRLKKIQVEKCSLETLKHIRRVAPEVELMNLMYINGGKKNEDSLSLSRGGKLEHGNLSFPLLHTMTLMAIDRSAERSLIPQICPNLESLSYVMLPNDLKELQHLKRLKKLEIQNYNSPVSEQEVPVNFFESIEIFTFSSACGGPNLGKEIVKRPGALKELDIHCIHDIDTEEDFQQFCRHGNWEVLRIRRCDSLTLSRVFDILRFNPRLKELDLPMSIIPAKPLTELNAKMVEAIQKHCFEKKIYLTADLQSGSRCYFEPSSSDRALDMRDLFADLIIDTGNYIDSDDGEDEDPNFFDMLQRAMVGDYDIDDIYGDFYDSDFSYEM